MRWRPSRTPANVPLPQVEAARIAIVLRQVDEVAAGDYDGWALGWPLASRASVDGRCEREVASGFASSAWLRWQVVSQGVKRIMGWTLIVVGAILVVAALAIHYVIKGLTLFPHASLATGLVGVVILALGAFMARPGAAK